MEVYAHLQRRSLPFHDRARCGDLLVQVNADVGVLRAVTVTALLPLVTSLLILTALVELMSWVNWQLTVLALLRDGTFASLNRQSASRRDREVFPEISHAVTC